LACDAGVAVTETNNQSKHMMLAEIYGNVHIGLAFGGAAIGIGLAAAGGVVAISRNPAQFGKIFMVLLLGMALAEGMAILAYVLIPKAGL
jgi:F0F1-type ATP synthase membrane subunit c/vacuolar-type H+-ATPase subunit K